MTFVWAPGWPQHAAVPVQIRELSEPMQLGKYKVPAKTRVWLNVLGMHHDEKLFPEPHVSRPRLKLCCAVAPMQSVVAMPQRATPPQTPGLQASTACKH